MIHTTEILDAGILIVDDKEANILLMDRMLRGAGYTSVAFTKDPYEVCELHRKNRYALILLDLQMPGLDGFQVMEGLKQIEPGGALPVLVITAESDRKGLRALKAGARDFVSKPCNLEELLLRIHHLIEFRLLQRENRQLREEGRGVPDAARV